MNVELNVQPLILGGVFSKTVSFSWGIVESLLLPTSLFVDDQWFVLTKESSSSRSFR